MKQKQGPYQLVSRKSLYQCKTLCLCLHSKFKYACQPLAIHLQESLDKFLRCSTRMRIRECGNFLDQRVNTLGSTLALLHVLLHATSSSFLRQRAGQLYQEQVNSGLPQCLRYSSLSQVRKDPWAEKYPSKLSTRIYQDGGK